ncbi:Arc family DNA-binding protein [Pseudomonas syringae pv. coryli]|uniref:Arc family DNA-binding protein n=1 Tax=Pseudomonas syringae pv. coryli TaxID=317659 RepID=UPI003D2A6525
MSRSDPQFNLRIPEALRDLVMVAAKQNKRSATAEILDRLERSFNEPDDLGISDLDRTNPESSFYNPSHSAQITTKIQKERLIAGLDEPLTAQEETILSAMIKALRGVGKFEEDPEAPNTGPKPRTRYPKE